MDKIKRTLSSVILLSCFNLACSSGGGGSDDDRDGPILPNDSPTAVSSADGQQTNDILIQGFWNLSITDDNGQVEEEYVVIGPDGVVTSYIHEQNISNTGRNCFNIEQSELRHLGNNLYRQTDQLRGVVNEFTATKTANTLNVRFVDVDDENENGNRTETLEESFPMVVGFTAVDLTVCDADILLNTGSGEPLTGADGILGHPPAEFIGTWKYRSVTVDQSPADLATQLGFVNGAVEARLHIMTNSAYFYEEVDSRGGQLWAEWGFIYFNDGVFDLNRQFDQSGPAEKMSVVTYLLQDGALILAENISGRLVVYVLRP